MSEHPYRSQPDRAFWSRSVAQNYEPFDVASIPWPTLRFDDRIVSAGSCFAANVVPWLEPGDFEYVRTEPPHPAFAHIPENLGYRDFSAAYGNVYTARHLRQLLERACGEFHPAEDRWHIDGTVIDPFRPGLRHPARSDREFDLLTGQHLRSVRRAFERATVVLLTLGLTEGWESSVDGAAYPACPGTVAGTFDPQRHRFHNYTAAEVTDDLRAFVARLRTLSPSCRVILTVSPVPLVATATGSHVLAATTYSKAVLRVSAETICSDEDDCYYFPAYEIVTGPQAPATFFADDHRQVTEEGVAAVMNSLMYRSLVHAPEGSASSADDAPPAATNAAATLSGMVTDAECDEMYADR